MNLRELLEKIHEKAVQESHTRFAPLSEEQLRVINTNFKSYYLSPSKLSLIESLEVKGGVNPDQLIRLACEEIDLRGLTLYKLSDQNVMTNQGPRPIPMPIRLNPEEVNRDGGLRKMAEVFYETLMGTILGGSLYSNVLSDLATIEEAIKAMESLDEPKLDEVLEKDLREKLKSSLIDVRALIKKWKSARPGQYI